MAKPQLTTAPAEAGQTHNAAAVGGFQASDGSVKGRLESLNVHHKNQFVIYPPYEGCSITCDFPLELFPTVQKAIKQNVTVFGTLIFIPGKPFPEEVRVKSIEIHLPDDELPDLQSLRGSWKASRDGRFAVDFIRRFAMNKPRYAWDSSVFLAWLWEDETFSLGGVESVIQEITPLRNTDNEGASPRAILIVSVIAYAEILEARQTAEQMDQLEGFLKRSNVILANNDIRIAQKAGEIRSRGLAEKPIRKIKTPDATHLATALIYQADAFHTFDARILALNESPIIDGLKVCQPIALHGQTMMF